MIPLLIQAAVALIGSSVLASYRLLDAAAYEEYPNPRGYKWIALLLWIGALVVCVLLWAATHLDLRS